MLKRHVARSLRFGQDVFFRSLAALRIPGPIAVASRPCGFFGNFFITLNGIQFLDSLGLAAVPWWDKHCLYFDQSTAPNVWDTFFCPSEPDRPVRLSDPPRLRYYAGAHGMPAYRAQTPRLAANALMRRFAAPRRSFQAECDGFIADAFASRPAIGVHVRGTDAKRGIEARASIALDIIHREIRSGLALYPDAVIFLATDEEEVLGLFRRQYGDRLTYRDCVRSTDHRSIHGHYDTGLPATGFIKARDVLLDALILSQCTYLIRTHSAVTTFSLCWNPDLLYLDLERKYLNVTRQPWLHEAPPTTGDGPARIVARA